MRPLLLVCTVLTACVGRAQCDSTWRDSLDAYWTRIDHEYADSAHSPLKPEDRAQFAHLHRFVPDPVFCVLADFKPATAAEPFAMKTTTTRAPLYKVHGWLSFILRDQEFTLPVYEPATPIPGHPGHLFLPFTDLTNGEETYGGGRYIDLQAPLAGTVQIDFNRAYNPYCAYNDRYSCPIPPLENHIDAEVRAGVLKFHD